VLIAEDISPVGKRWAVEVRHDEGGANALALSECKTLRLVPRVAPLQTVI
jgi:hypothetical protein